MASGPGQDYPPIAMNRTPSSRPAPNSFACVRDTASVVGLATLVRSHPQSWPRLLARGARDVHLHRDSTVRQVVGSRLDEAALPRGRRDMGRLRGARWCAATLARNFGDLRVLDVDADKAVWLETTLIQDHGVAPSSARKVRAHALALRNSVARRLGTEPLQLLPSSGRPVPWEPRVQWSGYQRVRAVLPWELRVACDLVATCRLRPSTILRLRGQDVGSDGRSITVQGRRRRHTLPVPAFIQAELLMLANGRGAGVALWPGRTLAGTLGVTTLRRHLKSAAREAVDEEWDLTDLADLAASALGTASANPRGRKSSLRRIALRWVSVAEVPLDPVMPAHAGRLESLQRSVDALRSEVEQSRRRSLANRKATLHAFKEVGHTARRTHRGVENLREDVETLKEDSPVVARLTKRLDKVEAWARRTDGSKRRDLDRALRVEVSSLKGELRAVAESSRRTQTAVMGLVGLMLPLALRERERADPGGPMAGLSVEELFDAFAAEYPESAEHLKQSVARLLGPGPSGHDWRT